MLKRYNKFVNSVITSAREGTSVSRLFYQDDIESKHFVEKLEQCFKKETVLEVISHKGFDRKAAELRNPSNM